MPYYAVANGRTTGVFDNWEDCKDQVHGYSYNNYKKFDTPDQAWDFVDQHSSKGKLEQSFSDDSKQQGKNGVIIRERSYTSGRAGGGYFVEKYTRTYWKNN